MVKLFVYSGSLTNVQFLVSIGMGTRCADGCDVQVFCYWHHMEWRLLCTVLGHQQKTLGNIVTVCLGVQDSQQEVLNSLKLLFSGQTLSLSWCVSAVVRAPVSSVCRQFPSFIHNLFLKMCMKVKMCNSQAVDLRVIMGVHFPF